MADWGVNVLDIDGPGDAREAFLADCCDASGSFCLSVRVPEPAFADTTEQVFWRQEHWGTKGEVRSVTHGVSPGGGVRIQFQTANSGIVSWLEGVTWHYPALTFRYLFVEPAQGLAAWIEVSGPDITASGSVTAEAHSPEWSGQVRNMIDTFPAPELGELVLGE